MPEKDASRELRELRRYTWEIVKNGKTIEQFHIDLLPETYSADEPAKVNLTQTRGGGFADIFGFGFGSLTMAGTTGFTERRNANKGALSDDTADGFERWQQFRNFFVRFFQYISADPGTQYYMHFLNWTQDDYYIVFPTGLPQLQRNIQQTLLYRYNLQVTIIRRLQLTPYIQDERERTIEELATQGPKRVGVIADAIDTNLESLWEIYTEDVLNTASLPDIDDTAKDANTQDYLDKVVARNKPADFTAPTDSNDGLMTRTRTLSEKIGDYTNARTEFVNTTLEEVRAVAAYWRDVLDAAEYAVNVPAAFSRQIKETLCAVQSLLLYPQLFRSSVRATLTDLTSVLQDSGCATTLRF
jgi:hypothetical protein